MWSFLRRPALLIEGVRAAVSTASRGWWRRPPFVPIPDPTYFAWRRETAYGDPSVATDPMDLVHYLEWRRRFRRLR